MACIGRNGTTYSLIKKKKNVSLFSLGEFLNSSSFCQNKFLSTYQTCLSFSFLCHSSSSPCCRGNTFFFRYREIFWSISLGGFDLKGIGTSVHLSSLFLRVCVIIRFWQWSYWSTQQNQNLFQLSFFSYCISYYINGW